MIHKLPQIHLETKQNEMLATKTIWEREKGEDNKVIVRLDLL